MVSPSSNTVQELLYGGGVGGRGGGQVTSSKKILQPSGGHSTMGKLLTSGRGRGGQEGEEAAVSVPRLALPVGKEEGGPEAQLQLWLRPAEDSAVRLGYGVGLVVPEGAHTPIPQLVAEQILRPLQAQVDRVDQAGATLFLHGSVGLLSHLECVRQWLLVSEAVMCAEGDSLDERVQAVGALAPPDVTSWPLCEVITPASMSGYAKVRAFLLRVHHVSMQLQEQWVTVKGNKGRGDHNTHLLVACFDMGHFVNTIASYVNWQVREVCWYELMLNLRLHGSSIRRLTHMHEAYVAKVERTCLVHSPLAVAAVNQVLGTVLHFCDGLVSFPSRLDDRAGCVCVTAFLCVAGVCL